MSSVTRRRPSRDVLATEHSEYASSPNIHALAVVCHADPVCKFGRVCPSGLDLPLLRDDADLGLLVAGFHFHTAPIFLRCPSTRAASARHFVGELRQRGGVAFGELADAAGEGLRDAVQLALHGGGDGGQPFVVHHEGLDFVLGERGVFGVELGFEVVLRGLSRALSVGLLVEQRQRVLRARRVSSASSGSRPISLSAAALTSVSLSTLPSRLRRASPSSPLCSSQFVELLLEAASSASRRRWQPARSAK